MLSFHTALRLPLYHSSISPPPPSLPLHSLSPPSLVLRVATGVDDPVHVQVEIVKFDVIGVGLCCIHWHRMSIHILGLGGRRARINMQQLVW